MTYKLKFTAVLTLNGEDKEETMNYLRSDYAQFFSDFIDTTNEESVDFIAVEEIK